MVAEFGELLDKIFSEYGLTVVLLFIFSWKMWQRNNELTDNTIAALNNNTAAMIKLEAAIQNKLGVQI